jgi:RNA polymerase sigma-70 factor (ECF subfamily)
MIVYPSALMIIPQTAWQPPTSRTRVPEPHTGTLPRLWNLFSRPKQVLIVDDAALLRRARKGDESAFCELFDRYERRIHQYASRMCGSAAGDDVVQETFLAVLKAPGFDTSKGSVAGYLFGIARHHVIKRLPKWTAASLESPDARAVDIVPADSPFQVMARDQTVVAVREAVESLPPHYREVVVLCDLQEMDYAMVADVIQCPIGTVRSRLHRARALLAPELVLFSPRELRRRHG